MKKRVVIVAIVLIILTGSMFLMAACCGSGCQAPDQTPEGFQIAFNLGQEWESAFGTNFPQVALIARRSIAETNPGLVQYVANMFETSSQFARANPQETERMINSLGSPYLAGSPIANFLVDRGEQVVNFGHAAVNQVAITNFLTTLHATNPPSVGGSVPSSDFFFMGSDAVSTGTETISIYLPDGPPLIAAAYLFYNEPQIAGRNVNFVSVTAANLMPAIASPQGPDFALVPINMAAQHRANYVVAGVALWSLLHIVENASLTGGTSSLSDLIGETIFAYQPNLTPGVVLGAIFANANIEVNWKNIGDAKNPNAVNIVDVANNANARNALLGLNAAIGYARFALIAEPVATSLLVL